MKRNQFLLAACFAAALLLIVALASCGHNRALTSLLPSGDEGISPTSTSCVPTDASGAYPPPAGSNFMKLPVDARYKGPYRLPEGRIAYTQETIDEYPLLKQAGIQPGIYRMDEPVAGKSASEVNIDHDGMIAPSTGTVRALVLKVQYASTAGNHHWTNTQINGRLFELGSSIDVGSQRDYYEEQSYNQLHLTGDIYPTQEDTYYQVPGTPQWYGSLLKLSRQQWLSLMSQADDDLNFNTYDGDNNHIIDCLYLLLRDFSGGKELREYVGFPGSAGTWYPGDFGYDGVFVYRCAVLDDSAISEYNFVAFHETGHLLGLPDYYDYGGDYAGRDNPGPDGDESNGCGWWELMAAGNYVYPPQNLSALNKYILNWDTPINVTYNRHDVRISPVESGAGNIYRLWKNGETGPEYFLIENRGTAGQWIYKQPGVYPSSLYYQTTPSAELRNLPPGLLIWHVDERVFNGDIPEQDVLEFGFGCNDYEEHKFLDLEESTATYSFRWQGIPIVDRKAYYGGTYDPWPQTYGGTHNEFGPDTTPNSYSYDDELTYVTVSNIHWEGDDIVADLIIGGPDIEFEFPNPAVLSGVATLTPSLATNIASVHYYIDDNLVATLDEAPYAYEFDTTSYSFASVHFRAVAENPDVPQDDVFEMDFIIDNTDGAFPQVVDFEGGDTGMAGTSMPSSTSLRPASGGYEGSPASFGTHRDIGGYDNALRALAALPLVDLTDQTAPTLVFFQHYNLESGPDTISVVVSTDGFASDFTVAKTQAGSDAIYSGYREDWQRVHVNLSAWAGQKVHVGFLIETNGNTSGEEPSAPAGWWVDHVVLATRYTDSVPMIENPGINPGTTIGIVPELPEIVFTPSASGDPQELVYALVLDDEGEINGSVEGPPFETHIEVSHLINQSAVLRLQVFNANDVPSPTVEVPLFIYNLRSDANSDGTVDEADDAAIAAAFGLTSSSASYRPWLDTNGDGAVDERDLSSVGYDFGNSL